MLQSEKYPTILEKKPQTITKPKYASNALVIVSEHNRKDVI